MELNIVLVEPQKPQNTGNISPYLCGYGGKTAYSEAYGLSDRR